MKKLQFLALSMLLSTGYMMQSSDTELADNNNMSNQANELTTSAPQPGQWKKGNNKKDKNKNEHGDKQDRRSKMDVQLTVALDGPVSFESLAKYAEKLPTALANLSASSSADDFKAVKEMNKNICAGLKQLSPKSTTDSAKNMKQNHGMDKNKSHGKNKKQKPADLSAAPVDNSANDSDVEVQGLTAQQQKVLNGLGNLPPVTAKPIM